MKRSDERQLGLSVFGAGNVVKLDGGKRLRLDDLVDFWPGSQNWQTVSGLAGGSVETASGVGVTSLLSYLKRMRAADGRPVEMPTPLRSNRQVACNYCGEAAGLHGGAEVYPDRKDLADRQFWVCWSCDAWVGCARDTDRPFGKLANEELRAARIAAHAAFDPVWQEERMTKSAAYEWLARELGLQARQCQIGLLELDACQQVSRIVWERFGAVSG